MIEESIEDALTQSDIKKQIQSNIITHLKKIGFTTKHNFTFDTTIEQFNNIVYEESLKKIQSDIQDVLDELKKEYNLSFIVNKILEEAKKVDEEKDNEMSLIIQNKYGSTYIYIDPYPNKVWYNCKYLFVLDNDFSIINISVDNQYINNRVSKLNEAENFFLKLWSKKARINIDYHHPIFKKILTA